MGENVQAVSATTQDGCLKGAVVYSDGGARPNPGYMGWGAHGYTYLTTPPTRGHGLQKHILTRSGYELAVHKERLAPVLVTPVEYFDFSGSDLETGTNNVAEVDALYYSLDRLRSHDLDIVHVLTDSEYARRGLTEWSKSWIANNWQKWDGTPIPNANKWKRLLAVIDHYRESGVEIKIQWIKGHGDNLGNETADRLATLGVMYSQSKKAQQFFNFYEPADYWKPRHARHPLLNFDRIYFNSLKKHNIPGRYFQAEPGCKEDQVGRKHPDASYSIVELSQPEPVLESVKRKQFDVANEVNVVMLLRAGTAFSDMVYPYIMDHGEHGIVSSPNRARLDLYSLSKQQLTEERYPAGLSLRAIEASGYLEELLECFKQHRSGQASTIDQQRTGLQFHNLTDLFFEQVPAKKKNTTPVTQLKAEYIVGFRNMDVTVNVMCGGVARPVTVPLVLGADLLPRNNLKRLEGLSPEVFLMTWKESEQSIRYACVVASSTGLGIWSNFFANRIFVQLDNKT